MLALAPLTSITLPLSHQWRALQWGVILLPINPILALLGLLWAFFSTWKIRFRQIIQTPLAWGFGILSLWLVIVTALAQYPLESLLGLPNFLPQFAVLLAFSLIIRRFAHLRFLAQGLSITSGILVILGFGQIYGHWSSPVWLSVIGTNLVAGGRPEGRMSSLLMYANLFSAYLIMVLPLALALFIREMRRSRKQKNLQITPQLFLLGCLVIGEAIALVLTDSRSAWGIGLLIFIAFAFYLTWYWWVALSVALGALIVGASFSPVGQTSLRQIVPRFIWGRLSDELYPDRYKTAFRSTQWHFAWQMMLDRPIWGQGLRNFTPLYEAQMNVWLGHPHNLGLMLLAEIGIPGTLLLLGLVGLILAPAVVLLRQLAQFRLAANRREQHLLLFAYLTSFGGLVLYNLFDVTIFDVRINLLGWIILAAIAGVSQRYGTIFNRGLSAGQV